LPPPTIYPQYPVGSYTTDRTWLFLRTNMYKDAYRIKANTIWNLFHVVTRTMHSWQYPKWCRSLSHGGRPGLFRHRCSAARSCHCKVNIIIANTTRKIEKVCKSCSKNMLTGTTSSSQQKRH